jgi:transcriptional regulator with XRE-family HTH domain
MTSGERAPKGSPRAVFGEMLRFYRERAGLSREALGEKAHISASTIGAYETGWRVPTRATVRDIDAVPEMHTGGALTVLWDQFQDGMNYQVFPAELQDWAETVEPVAPTFRWFESLIVPGLLQTTDYMRAIFSTRFGLTRDGLEERVAARLRRQEVLLREEPPALWVIIDEGVIRRPVGGRGVMLEQVNRLVEAAEQPSIRIEVIPASVGAHEGLAGGTFIVADFATSPSVGYVETSAGGRVLREHVDVAALDLTWATLRGEALPRSASTALLEEAAKAWSSAT